MHGFTYIGILFAVALLGISMAATGQLWSLESQRSRERELLWTGAQYRAAIASYYAHAPGGIRQLPRTIDELVVDLRGPTPMHHLRRAYPDPMTHGADWEIQYAADGGILGIASRASGKPIKQAGFSPADSLFEGATCYCDWRFLYLPALQPAMR